jgi:hypothetical protein
MLPAVGLGGAVPDVGCVPDDCIPGALVTALFLPMSVAVPLTGLVLVAAFSFSLARLKWRSSSLSSPYDRSLPTMDKGVKAYSDSDRKAYGDEKVAEADTDAGDAVDALPARVSCVSSCPSWVKAL